jgi:transglutaminase-like putative cysteine protease
MHMHIRVGFELIYECPQPTPMLLTLNVHYSRASDLVAPDLIATDPAVPIRAYRDSFGNWVSRIVAPKGRIAISTSAVLRHDGKPDAVAPDAIQHQVEDLPEDTLVFLLGSRYCETDLLSQIAWDRFGGVKPGWSRVQAICDFVYRHLTFGYRYKSATKTAFDAYQEARGVCRDYSHLAVALCRAMNIPARYCSGYLGDIGMPPPYPPMDFASWIEAYLGGRWYTFDPRNHGDMPRIGRVLIARGRDAADVPISASFGPNELIGFSVVTDEVAPR